MEEIPKIINNETTHQKTKDELIKEGNDLMDELIKARSSEEINDIKKRLGSIQRRIAEWNVGSNSRIAEAEKGMKKAEQKLENLRPKF